jgi:hypothetical protein
VIIPFTEERRAEVNARPLTGGEVPLENLKTPEELARHVEAMVCSFLGWPGNRGRSDAEIVYTTALGALRRMQELASKPAEPAKPKASSRRVEFKLSMPGRASWDGKWSGEDRNYTIVKTLPRKTMWKLFAEGALTNSWGYSFGDGWHASVSARIVPPGERLKKSYGFCGYDWMVDSILTNNKIITRS